MPPRNSNEVSVLRLFYTNLDFCKAHSKTLKFGENIYIGLAFIEAQKVEQAGEEYENLVSVVYSPLENLEMHADIFYNFFPAQGQTLPAAIKQIARKLIKYPPTFLCVECDKERLIAEWTGATQAEITQKCV